MDTLIAELEAATEGSRELDERVAPFAGWFHGHGRSDWTHPDNPAHAVAYVPKFTTSFATALTWMPKGCVIELCQSCPARTDDTWWDAYVFKRSRHHDSEPIGATEQGVPEPALAVCIAIAKAHRAMKENG